MYIQVLLLNPIIDGRWNVSCRRALLLSSIKPKVQGPSNKGPVQKELSRNRLTGSPQTGHMRNPQLETRSRTHQDPSRRRAHHGIKWFRSWELYPRILHITKHATDPNRNGCMRVCELCACFPREMANHAHTLVLPTRQLQRASAMHCTSQN